MPWTVEQVLALAPDPSVAKDGQTLAAPRKWLTLCSHADSVWGEIKGSGKTPYQTQIDLTGPGFKCSCPSHKRPCKHAVGLFLLVAQKAAFTAAEPPEWVTSYVANRAKRAEQSKKPVTDTGAQSERATERIAKVTAGLADLELWLHDTLRGGLTTLPQQPQKFWKDIAARLVDAQAPGLARLVNDTSSLPATGEGWQERVLAQLAKLHLLIESFKRLDSLPAPTQADVRALIGWPQTKAELANEPDVSDVWAVVGKHSKEEDGLKTQFTWLWGIQSERPALLLDFVPSGFGFETNFIPGTTMQAGLAFFPSNYPVRALTRTFMPPNAMKALNGYANIHAATAAYAQALARNPWLDLFPMLLANVIPMQTETGWQVRDTADTVLTIAPRFEKGWTLLALSGGHPVTVFGEWDGDLLLPLGVWDGKKFVGVA